MKRAILTAGLLFAALAASAKGADTILDKDPVGIYVTIVSVVTVLSALIVLFLLIQLFAKVMVKSAQKKAAKSKTRGILVDDMKVSVPAGCDSVVNGIGFVPAPIAPDDKKVHRVGTCEKWGNLRNVIWGAWDVCMKI
mgnify:CR=1 FL=1